MYGLMSGNVTRDVTIFSITKLIKITVASSLQARELNRIYCTRLHYTESLKFKSCQLLKGRDMWLLV